MRLEVNAEHPEPRKIARAVAALQGGDVIAYPTDTVYGLGCAADDKGAIDTIYAMKRVKKDHPVAFLVPDLSHIARYAFVDDAAYRLMRRLVPGPYTFILPASRDAPRYLLIKRKTVGIRVPAHPVPRAILEALGAPLVSTSATRDGEQLRDPDEIDDVFPGLALVLDVGMGGIEPSTIVDLTGQGPVVTREGKGDVDWLVR